MAYTRGSGGRGHIAQQLCNSVAIVWAMQVAIGNNRMVDRAQKPRSESISSKVKPTRAPKFEHAVCIPSRLLYGTVFPMSEVVVTLTLTLDRGRFSGVSALWDCVPHVGSGGGGCAGGGVPLGAVPVLSWCGEVCLGSKQSSSSILSYNYAPPRT